MAMRDYHMNNLNADPKQATAVELLGGLVTDLGGDLGRFYDVTVVGEIEENETEARSGFIPSQNGGFELVAYADFNAAYGSGCIPHAIADMLEQTLRDCESDFRREKGLADGVNPWDKEQVGEEVQEEYWDWENTWLSEGTTYFYKVRVILYDTDNGFNETGEPEALILAGINTDLEYGRDNIPWLSHYGGKPQQTGWGFEQVIPLSQISKETIKEIRAKALDALAGA